jgi:hypothetical protein
LTKHLLWYTKSLPGGDKFRKLAVNLNGKESILEELQCSGMMMIFSGLPDYRSDVLAVERPRDVPLL